MILRLTSLIFLLIVICIPMQSQQLWKQIPESSIRKSANDLREIVPDHYLTLHLDFKGIQKSLLKAPSSKLKGNEDELVVLELPLPDGSMTSFGFYESSSFSPLLQEKYPHIRSYRGIALDGSGDQARVDFGDLGFHAVMKTSKGDVYIDPFHMYRTDNYISYYTRDDHQGEEYGHLTCGTEAHKHFGHGEIDLEASETLKESIRKNNGTPVTKFTYRLALACTGRWGDIFADVSTIMSRFNTGVNRLNMIYENELGAKFELIDNNDELIFFGANEPYTFVSEGRRLVGQNTRVLDDAVGNDAYDIGHVFTVRCTDGVAGIASLGSLCNATSKGNGVSCIGSRGVSNFMVSVTAHEIGHQFSAIHTWNNCPGNEQNISTNGAYEPGSGSTIMSYAGLCGGNNITGNGDDYFHAFSIQQMYTLMSNARCGEKVESDNHAPDLFIPLGDGLTIPISTPFELDGSAVDKDGDQLTYNWDQMDLGPSSNLGDPMGNAPSFRSLYPSTETKRIFPNLVAVLNNLNPATEVLPTYSRDLTFRFTARDNHPGVGITVYEEIDFEATESAGPFVITEPSSLSFADVGSNYTIEWDVANTDNDEVNCQFVDIFLSLDNGQNFDIILKENTPNDGSETIVIPNEVTTDGRIKVKARNNIFFNINQGKLIIREPSNPGFYVDVSENNLDVCVPEQIVIDISGTSFQDFDNPVTLDIVSGLPPDAIVEFSENPISPTESTTLTITMDPAQISDTYEIVMQAVSENADTINQLITANITGADMSDLSLTLPVSGAFNLSGTPTFEWTPTANAESYTLEVATSPTFGNTNAIRATNILGNTFTPTIVLDNSQLFYWRVIAENRCVNKPSEIFTFGTITLACNTYEAEDLPRNISQGLPTIESQIVVLEEGTIADVNVELLKIGHGSVRDLRATVISPSGKEVELFAGVCATANVSIGFDSDSPLLFGCPLNTGRAINPQEESLFDFEGEEAQGIWTMQIKDERAGDGGRFDDFVLELCGSVTTNNPYIVNNFVLEVPTGKADRLNSSILLSEDDDNSANELIYTIVIETTNGSLYINGAKAEVGTRFTQADINNNAIRYVHEGSEDESDFFVFTVIDGEGGWIDLTRFDINMEKGFTSSTEDLVTNDAFKIFPNPTKELIHISQNKKDGSQWKMQFSDINGRVILRDQFSSNMTINASEFETGIYLLILTNGEKQLVERISVVK